MSSLTPPQLDAVYTRLCKTMTEVGEANAPLFLARFALLAVAHIGEGEVARRLIDAACEDLVPAAKR